jgi:hypothetical protein
MPDGTTQELTPVRYEDEAELESAICRDPNLLQYPGEPRLKTIERRVKLPDAGVIDVMLTDDQGTPIVVEVKLARNGETRRQIVAQIFDYVSDLSLMTADEIDDLVDDKLGNALDDPDRSVSDTRWKYYGRQVREGRTRFILAVDEAPDSLVRIMEFLKRHTNLDVRLINVYKQHRSDRQEHLFVPEFKVVRSEQEIDVPGPQGKSARPVMPELQDYFEFLRTKFPSIYVRQGRYAIISLGAGCQARIDPIIREGSIRVSFKSFQKPREEVEEAVRSTLGDPDDLAVNDIKLDRKFSDQDHDIIWWTTSIPLPKEGGFGDAAVRRNTAERLRQIESAFRPAVAKLRREKNQ